MDDAGDISVYCTVCIHMSVLIWTTDLLLKIANGKLISLHQLFIFADSQNR